MIGAMLRAIEPGEVRVVRCADPADALVRLRLWGEREARNLRVVVCYWSALPAAQAILDEAIDALARTALALWPNWYGAREGAATPPRGTFAPWVDAAVARCRAGQVPRLSEYANAVQAAQLALAVEPRRLHLVLSTTAAHAPADSLVGLARAAEWLARETLARVAVFVPRAAADSQALDSINYRAVDCPEAAPAPAAVEEKGGLWVWPFHGNPHPDSPGEQLLARRLAEDAELAGLFAFNEPVQTVRGSTFTVDLVWRAGKVIVEVDGYHWHSDPVAFRQDRHRDYELTASGFLVLRLTHDEVMEDAALALEKIRDVAALRRRNPSERQGVRP